MNTLFTLILLLCAQLAFSQKKAFCISGQVRDADVPTKRLYAIKVRVTFNDSLFIETDCDSLGNYKLYLSPAFPRSYSVVVTARQDIDQLEALFPILKSCPFYSHKPNLYMSSGQRRVIPPREKLTNFSVDFELHKLMVDYRSPQFNFKKNSLELLAWETYHPDSIIRCLKTFLQEEPNIIMEISGHAWEEKLPKKLALQRAGLAKQKLAALGIDEERIVVSGHSSLQPLFDRKKIRQAKTKEEKEALKTLNRRVELRILSWDYDPVLKKRVSPATQKAVPGDDEE